MEIRSQGPISSARPVVVATRPGSDRHSREGQWQPAASITDADSDKTAGEADTLATALRGRWITDARREASRDTADAQSRSRQMRQRLEETYRPDPSPAGDLSSRDPLDLVV